jgi:hypothetical protein
MQEFYFIFLNDICLHILRILYYFNKYSKHQVNYIEYFQTYWTKTWIRRLLKLKKLQIVIGKEKPEGTL